MKVGVLVGVLEEIVSVKVKVGEAVRVNVGEGVLV